MGYDENYTGKKLDKSIPIKTFSFKEDYIGFNELLEVIDSGEKETFLLKTERGKSIIVSEEHPFKVKEEKGRGNPEKDNFVALKELTLADEVMIKSQDEIKVGLEGRKIHWEKIISIDNVGKKHTYDIRMKKPYSNFVANDFIVHNTGKSLMAAVAMRDPQLDMIMILETEGGGHAKELIEFAGVDPNKVRIIKAHTFGNYKVNKKNNKIEEIADSKFPVKTETPENVFVEGAIRKVKKLVHALQFNKNLEDAKILLVLDSLGNLQSVREFGGTIDMGARSQDVGKFFRTFDTAFEASNIGFIFTNKLYTNIGNIYDPWKETGGVNAAYNPSLGVRFTEMASSDEISDSEMTTEKDRRKTSLGSSIKNIRAQIMKSRFGTERRNAWFILDAAVGPIRYSGLFTLLKDFDVMVKNGSSYRIKGWNNDKSFFKKNFIELVLADEEKTIDLFQELLTKREIEIKEAKKNIKVNDISELSDNEDGYETSEMISAMEKDMDG